MGDRVLVGSCGLGLGWCCWYFVKRVCCLRKVRYLVWELVVVLRRGIVVMLRVWCWIRCLRSRLCPVIEGWGESVVGRWVTLERDRRQAVRGARPDPREMEAEITALRRRVRELEKENEFLGKASAFFASRHHNTSALN